MMVKALIFDIDNTLYSYDAAHQAAFQVLADNFCEASGLSRQRFSNLHREADRILRARAGSSCAAIHNRLIRYQIMLEQIGKPVSYALELADIYWGTLLSNMQCAPGARECMSFLKAAGYTVGIGTNMTADYQYIKLERLGLLDYVDFMVSSEEAGAEKPDKRLFDLCVEKAGGRAGACMFIGDSLEADALGAMHAGLRPVWLCGEEKAVNVPAGIETVHSLSDIPDLLHSIQNRAE